MPVVEIPEVGEVEFPDDMAPAEIGRAAKGLYLESQMAVARKEGARTEAMERGITRDVAWTDFILRPFASTPENPLGGFGSAAKGAGLALNEAGNVAAGAVRDVRTAGTFPPTAFPATVDALQGRELGPAPGGPVGAGLEAAGRAVPIVAGAMALQGAGVPAPVAFAGPPAASTLAATGDTYAAVQAAAIGAAIPGVAQMGREAAAMALGRAVNAGVLAGGANTTQKIAEALTAQGAIQVFMEGMNLPAYAAMSPDQRRDALIENLVANTAFLVMDVPGIVRKGPSATQGRIQPAAKAGEIMEKLVNDPAAVEALRVAADEYALQATDPRRAQMRVTELQREEPQLEGRAPQVPETTKEVMPRGEEIQRQEEVLDRPAAPTISEPTPPPVVENAPAPAAETRVARQRVDYGRRTLEKREGDTYDPDSSDDLAFDRGGVPTGTITRSKARERYGRDYNIGERVVTGIGKDGKTIIVDEVVADTPANAPAPAAEMTKPSRDWDLFYEDLVGNLDSFSPARHTGRIDYEMDDVAQRFVDYARADQSGRPLIKLVTEFASKDEASAGQIKKLKAAVKDLEPQPSTLNPQPSKAPRPGDTSEATRAEQPAQPGGQPPPSAPPEPPVKRVARGITGKARFIRETEIGGTDILDWIDDFGGMMSKSEARRRGKEWWKLNASLYDDATTLAAPHHNIIYRGGSAPDVVAQAAYEAGRLKAPDVTELWSAIRRATHARAGIYQNIARESKILKGLEEDHAAWMKATAKGEQRVTADQLKIGDLMEVDGERVKVTGIDPDTGDVTLEDGKKFGTQIIREGTSIHVEKFKTTEASTEFGPEVETLQLAKPETIEEQNARLAGEEQARSAAEARRAEEERLATAKRKMLERAAAPLGGDLGSAGQGGLFVEPGQQEIFQTKPPRTSAMGDPVLAAPVPPNAPATPPPGTPGTAQLFDMRLPVTLPRSAKGAVSIPQVMAALENVIVAAGGQTPIRVGRFNKARARGIYKPREEVVRVNSADNIPTATHEIGHASQKLLYGSAYARGLKGLPPASKRELVALGRALYGNTRPAAGYSGEGWAEFIRHYITTDDAARLAPATEKYFREKVLVDHPELARAVKQARDLVDIYRAQGSVARAQQQIVKAPGRVASIVKTLRDTVGIQAQVDEFHPLWKLSQGYTERSGNVLAPAEDPFLLASWKRGTAGAVVETMVNDHMIDPWGNPRLAPGNVSLRQALAPIKGRGEDFALYLFGRRAVERWGKGKNPGLTREDAQYLVSHFDSPEFQLAAQNYYEWHRGLLEYVREADPSMSGTIDAILASSEDYAPLARVIEPKDATADAAAARANPLSRMHGSGRQVRDIFETTLENAARLVSHAHRKMVLQSIVKLSKKEGMGFLVEEVPRSKVRTEVNFEKLREELEAAGVDTSNIPQDAVLTYFDLADKPKGADPIVVVKEADGLHWYHLSPGVYELLNGLKPASLADIPHIGKALDLLIGAPARAFRMGTTGLRPSFALFTNPTRDLRTLLVQTQSSANPARLGAAYFSALGEVVRAGLGGKASPHVEAFNRLGAQLGQPLGGDIRHTKRAIKGLFHGKIMRVVTNPIDHLRDLLQITESAPRVAELKLIAEEVGWRPGQTMTPDQAVQIALAAKRVTVDFSAGGRIAKMINQAVPFYNATIQGTRSFARAMRDNPARAVLYGLATFTVPALLNWYRNKDKEWYRQLPWRERYLYDNIEADGEVIQIPRPFEWGNLFSVLPEAILDGWYQQDPRGAEEAFKHMLATANPLDYPVPLKIAKEQWQNRIDFFDRPIVPRVQVDLPPGDQRGPYTTRLGEWLGNAFPNTVSPRRIDAGVRSYFGGAVPDLLDAVGLGAVKREREAELSDLPVLGRMFRRGGEFSASNLAIGDYYDDLSRYGARGLAMEQAMREGRTPLNPLDAREYAYWKLLEGLRPAFKAASQVAEHTESLSARQSLYRDMAREAARVTALRPK